ncbi:hypothetical protein J6590_094681 [Homalodisca vitripennis]|nr:hypothetical protein J6590_103155 [Homalodisca vitripennis]KAG8319307.1 hypothetical protein J6590_094681 [Homalodisca vitripennis]
MTGAPASCISFREEQKVEEDTSANSIRFCSEAAKNVSTNIKNYLEKSMNVIDSVRQLWTIPLQHLTEEVAK